MRRTNAGRAPADAVPASRGRLQSKAEEVTGRCEEIEHLLTTKTVVGEPIKIGDNTIIPPVAIGFGFGGGGGTGEDPKAAGSKGAGSGAGGGAGIRPIALVVIDKEGKVRVESVRASSSIVDKMGDAVVRAVEAAQKAKTTAPA